METLKSINWDVLEIPSVFKLGNKYVENRTKTLVRSDDKTVLSVVNNSYSTTQPKWFVSQVESLGLIGELPVKGYQEFDEGRKILGYLETDKKKICGIDYKEMMVLCTGYDNQSTFLGTTSRILRCENEFGRIIKNSVIKHCKNHDFNMSSLLNEYKQFLLLRNKFYKEFEKFGKIKIAPSIPEKLANHVLSIDPEQKVSTRSENLKIELLDSIKRETTDLGMNVFGLFNGVTHYTTHKVTTKKENVMGNFFGVPATINAKAFNFCKELVN